jgi:hypothetical protein
MHIVLNQTLVDRVETSAQRFQILLPLHPHSSLNVATSITYAYRTWDWGLRDKAKSFCIFSTAEFTAFGQFADIAFANFVLI